MKVPRFADLVEVTVVGDREITLTCIACEPHRVIGRFFDSTTLNQLIAAANDHDKDR